MTTTPAWYAVYTRSRFEKKVVQQFHARGVEHWLPLLTQMRQWKDRRKRVEMPLFPGYVFVRIDLENQLGVLSVDGVVNLVGRAGTPEPIPSDQLDQVRQLLKHPERVRIERYVSEGDRVEIVSGPFAKVRGTILEVHGRHRVLVGVDLIRQGVSVEVDLETVRMLNDAAA